MRFVLWFAATALAAQSLSTRQAAILRSIDEESPAAISLLERIVNINSGTFNPVGVAEVSKILEPEFHALGFSTRRISMDVVQRGAHLVAERKGSRGKRLLLIGHMDTVFEPSSPFQRFIRTGDSASGPGVSDMKGGIVVMLSALKALNKAGALDDSSITVFLTGDEESPGEPVEVSRKEFIEAGKNSDAAICFEGGVRHEGKDFASTARRGATTWELRVHAKTGHSGGIFSDRLGDGAIYEISRILNQFRESLREPNLTYSVGMIVGGARLDAKPGGSASVSGKANVVPGEALAVGDIRALSSEQLARIKDKMHSIVSRNLTGTKAEIKFVDKYPPMAPSAGNVALLAKLNKSSDLLREPEIGDLDPMLRGAGDISFVAPYVDSLSGLGANGSGAHAAGESVDLARLPIQAKRAALLIYQLIR
jgi:glutamate carboxypeptidase